MAEASKQLNPPCSSKAVFSPFKIVNNYIKEDNGKAKTASLNDITDAQFKASFRKMLAMKNPKDKAAWLTARGFFDKYISLDNFTLTYAQTFVAPGSPLNIDGKRYKNRTDGEKEQQKVYKDFAKWLEGDIKKNSVDGGY